MIVMKVIPAICLLLVVVFGLIPTAKYLIQNRKRVSEAVRIFKAGTTEEKTNLLRSYELEYYEGKLDKDSVERAALSLFEESFSEYPQDKKLEVFVKADEDFLTKVRLSFYLTQIVSLFMVYLSAFGIDSLYCVDM